MWAKILQLGLSIANTFLGNKKTAEDKKSGANEVDLKNREAYDESRKDAKDIGGREHNRFKRRGVQRKRPTGDD